MVFWLLMIPVALQGLAFAADELIFHRRRGLPKWERLGHPMDTLSIMVPLIFAFSSHYSVARLSVFAALGLASCLFVTKDEFVHAALCDPKEQWLHSVLFVLHPLLFVSIGILWYLEYSGIPVTPGGDFKMFLTGQLAFMASVFTYQILYWSVLWPRKQAQSTTPYTVSSVNAGTPPRMIR